MSAYVVFIKEEVTDQSELDAYSQKVGSSFQGRDLKFLATYGALETLEGVADSGGRHSGSNSSLQASNTVKGIEALRRHLADPAADSHWR